MWAVVAWVGVVWVEVVWAGVVWVEVVWVEAVLEGVAWAWVVLVAVGSAGVGPVRVWAEWAELAPSVEWDWEHSSEASPRDLQSKRNAKTRE